jgi:hypothetical protein
MLGSAKSAPARHSANLQILHREWIRLGGRACPSQCFAIISIERLCRRERVSGIRVLNPAGVALDCRLCGSRRSGGNGVEICNVRCLRPKARSMISRCYFERPHRSSHCGTAKGRKCRSETDDAAKDWEGLVSTRSRPRDQAVAFLRRCLHFEPADDGGGSERSPRPWS